MAIAATWHGTLTAPAPGEHIAQLYREPGFLARAVGRFTGEGIRQGDGVILVATPLHWRMIARRLEQDRLGPDDLQRRGQLTVLDAVQTLAQFMVEGRPDRARFQATVGGMLDSVRAAGFRRVRAFGEMVDLLRHISLEATIRLEQLWNELLAAHRISLLCGYSLDAFDPHTYQGTLQQVCAVHSGLVPVEDYSRLERAVTRAYADIFGASRDTAALRSALLENYTSPAAMPDAQAAIFAVREFVPLVSNALVDRVRHHYRTGASPGVHLETA